jgi:hypothetical protein
MSSTDAYESLIDAIESLDEAGVQRALDKGADPNRKDAFGNTALDYYNARILGEDDAQNILDAFA